MKLFLTAPLLVFLLALGACGGNLVPLSTSGDVAGYDDLVALFADNPEAAARFDIFEAQADGIQALSLIERAVTHPEAPASLKTRLKSAAATLTAALRDYGAVVTACPGKQPDGACPDFDHRNAKVLAFRNILQSVQSELLRLAGQGLLAAS